MSASCTRRSAPRCARWGCGPRSCSSTTAARTGPSSAASSCRAPTRDLRVVKFRRNAGQTAAMAAGIDHARGEVLITMDGDLQNDPQDIPLFLAKIAEGYDLVVGWRHDRQDHWSRVLPSKVANWLIGKVTGVPIKDNGCSLKAYRADLIKNIPLYNEMHRFIPAMASLAAPRIAQIKVRHHARRFGQSKYGFSRIYKVFVDLVTIRSILSFSRRPATWLGIVVGLRRAGRRCSASAASLSLLTADPPRSSDGVHEHERAAGLAVDLQRVPGAAQPSDLRHHRHPLPPVPDDVGQSRRGPGRPSLE